MSFIIGKSCVDCMDTACASACPVDCIHGPINMEGSGGEIEREGREAFPGGQMYINPDTCINCEHVFQNVLLAQFTKMKIWQLKQVTKYRYIRTTNFSD